MEIVASNSQQDLDRQRFESEIRWAARSLLSNLIRVARGAGKAHEIDGQLRQLSAAIENVHQIGGGAPVSYQLETALSFSREFDSPDARQVRWHYAEEAMISGAMQIVASRLVDQGTQATAGHRQMFEGLFELEKMREENRKEVVSGRRRTKR